jgi:hypothetical protein
MINADGRDDRNLTPINERPPHILKLGTSAARSLRLTPGFFVEKLLSFCLLYEVRAFGIQRFRSCCHNIQERSRKMASATDQKVRDSSSDCKVCDNISRLLTGLELDDSANTVNLGSFETALASDCLRHKALVQRFADYCGYEPGDKGEALGQGMARRQNDDVGLVRQNIASQSVGLRESLSFGGRFWDVTLVKDATRPDHPGVGIVLDADWANLDALNQWKSECMNSHGVKCENPMRIWPVQPAWLIDCDNKCVIPGKNGGAFVALSYRWGEDLAPRPRITNDIMAKLQQHGALDSPEMSQYLAPIIKHAIQLSSRIGERYLWVDALCIVYDDLAATAEQLELMGAIYANASITIVAADEDSQAGLLGLRDISAPRNLEQHVIPFGDETIIVLNADMFSMIHGTPYYERGWTYQEHIMAKRRILFNSKALHWECQCNQWHEDTTLGAAVPNYIEPRLREILAGFPTIGSLSNMLTNYNTRGLTYDEDALLGISGLLSVLSRSFTGGFLYGIPEMFFDRAIGWTPYWTHTNLRRRTASDRNSGHQLSVPALPSWSWIGWQGLVSLGDEAALINDRSSRIAETTPITEWFTGKSPTEPPSQRRRIRSSWYENREARKDTTKPLPPGWTRQESPPDESTFRNEPRLWPTGCGGQTFKHPNLPDEDYGPTDLWYYPFPVLDIQPSTVPFTPEQTPFLFCETKRTWLWAKQTDSKNVVGLHTKEGAKIGSLRLHNEEQLGLVPNPEVDGGESEGLKVELAAIYRSREHSRTWNETEVRYTVPINIRDTYTVLWIEWVDGVAYRLGSGQIPQADWEALELQEVSLVLG